MGVLYYVTKLDGSHEMFALNKAYAYDDGTLFRLDGRPLREVFATETALSSALTEYHPPFADWYGRIAARLFQWAGEAPIQYVSEHAVDDLINDLTYEERRGLITGSAHDADYEDDGMTYKPGSAW